MTNSKRLFLKCKGLYDTIVVRITKKEYGSAVPLSGERLNIFSYESSCLIQLIILKKCVQFSLLAIGNTSIW